MKYFLIAGEASGDLHAANLMKALKQQDTEADFRYFGGDLMAAQGGTLIKHYREMAFMGFIPVLLNLRTIFRNMAICKEEITRFSPDVVILIDYPGFNLKIAKFVKEQLNLPVHYYISPKIWAWKEYRIKAIKHYVDCMLSILPFEVTFYAKHNYPITYVGNPTFDEISHFKTEIAKGNRFIQENNLDERPIVALLAGSRKQEIKANLPLMLEAAKSFPDHQFIVAGAPGIEPAYYNDYLQNSEARIVYQQTFPLLYHAKAALVTSGTATLETALFGVPQAVCYYQSGGKLLYYIVEKVLNVRYVSLVNLIVDQTVVKELLGYKATAESLKEELQLLLEAGEYRDAIMKGYQQLQSMIETPGAPFNAAQKIISEIKKS